MTFVFFLLLLDLYSACVMLQQPGIICLLTLKLLTLGQSDPFATWAKHYIYEAYILKNYGNPITLDRSE